MNNVRHIAFGYSTKCNIRCNHCVSVDGLTQNATMEFNAAKSIIQQMADCNVTGISFTAGEPFIFLDDISNLIELCRKNSIYSRVVTNGFWAKTQNQSDNIVSGLLQRGLSQLRISFSRWHQENIDRKNIVHAVSSCKKYGIDYFISFITDFSEEDDRYEQFLRDNNLKFFPEPVIYFGRAKGFKRKSILTDYHPNICSMNPYLSPELDMFACCDAGSHFTKTDFFLLGNLKDKSVDELFRKKEENSLYCLIKTMGLTNIASYMGFKASEIVQYRKCELCEKLFNSVANLRILEESLEEPFEKSGEEPGESSLRNWTR
jgi:organic radical activating enzyme